MASSREHPISSVDDLHALRSIFEGTASETGERFFESLVMHLARALGTYGAWVTEWFPEQRRLRAFAFWMDDHYLESYEVDVTNTPCELVVDNKKLIHIPDRIMDLYPDDPDVVDTNAVSYMGMPLMDFGGTVLGHLAVLDTKPLDADERVLAIFNVFAARAAAELRRLYAERSLREREEELSQIVNNALDAIVEIDDGYGVALVNPAAEALFGWNAEAVIGRDIRTICEPLNDSPLEALFAEADSRPPGQQSLWIPGGLICTRAAGPRFLAEATLSRFPLRGRTCHTLILRDLNHRIEAEKTIDSLRAQQEYLRQELREAKHFGEIVGNSPAIRRVAEEIFEVSATSATVLILGETGTGKELVARAIHNESPRREKPLIKVNCAAIPATLIESEFFGHEKGAFTGATEKREGRFALAHGGTIFLDEVGELPLDLQSKLLRVLQEGEFEPVGSAKTRTVDVRVIAATNRDLKKAVAAGTFREDLYYRLNVFPVELPPLRKRGDDIQLLAQTFAIQFATPMGRSAPSITPDCVARLKAYSWPGNVRELQNVIERAVITSRDGLLNLDRALPSGDAIPTRERGPAPDVDRIYTAQEMQILERDNIVRALEATDWQVSGTSGAANRLGMNPSTLSSRIRALGISRPEKG